VTKIRSCPNADWESNFQLGRSQFTAEPFMLTMETDEAPEAVRGRAAKDLLPEVISALRWELLITGDTSTT
jgi:hypothetical protein